MIAVVSEYVPALEELDDVITLEPEELIKPLPKELDLLILPDTPLGKCPLLENPKLLKKVRTNMLALAREKKAIIGIGTGFVLLAKMRLLDLQPTFHPWPWGRTWVKTIIPDNAVTRVFFQERHAFFPVSHPFAVVQLGEEELKKAMELGQIALLYEPIRPHAVISPAKGIAALSDVSGWIIGMMPNPLAYTKLNQNPLAKILQLPDGPGGGQIFLNAILQYVKRLRS